MSQKALDDFRLARCPQCQHEGAIPRAVETTARLRCRTCGEISLVRECDGPRPTKHRKPSRAAANKAAAVKDVLTRYGDPELDDPLDDLWSAG